MSRTTRRGVRFGIPLVVVALSTLATLIILDVVDFDTDRASPAEGARSERTSTLSFCVDTFNLELGDTQSDALRDEAKIAVEDALLTVESDKPEHIAKLEDEGTRYIDKGCPGTPVLANIKADGWKDGFYVEFQGARIVDDDAMMSPYRVHFYVVSREELDERLAGNDRRRFTQESRCTGDVCVPVTGGVYVTIDELRDAEFMAVQMEITAGLREE